MKTHICQEKNEHFYKQSYPLKITGYQQLNISKIPFLSTTVGLLLGY
ncbi:hypothetical protein QFZ20_001244 [Flavobacterium sp. W4I14]|nr:hypothetical protein [Flavobacterium sp. W4I14]